MGQPRCNWGGYTDRSDVRTETATRLDLLKGGWSDPSRSRVPLLTGGAVGPRDAPVGASYMRRGIVVATDGSLKRCWAMGAGTGSFSFSLDGRDLYCGYQGVV
jgi:hypothetical protein